MRPPEEALATCTTETLSASRTRYQRSPFELQYTSLAATDCGRTPNACILTARSTAPSRPVLCRTCSIAAFESSGAIMFIRRISEGTLSTVAAIELFLAAQLAGVSSGPFFVWLAARAGFSTQLIIRPANHGPPEGLFTREKLDVDQEERFDA